MWDKGQGIRQQDYEIHQAQLLEGQWRVRDVPHADVQRQRSQKGHRQQRYSQIVFLKP